MLGVYAYFDKKDFSVVYIGKDSHIENNMRDKAHKHPSKYNAQPFNKIIQSNPSNYIYQVLVWDVKDQDTLNALEIQYIRQLKPKFNFTNGGDGVCGFKHSEETKRKMSKNHWDNGGKNHPNYGKQVSEETKNKISNRMKGSDNPFYGKKHSAETKHKISKSMSKYSMWNTMKCYYSKDKMNRNNREPNPCKCFYLKYNGHIIHCGLFLDFITVELIYDFIEDEVV